MDTVERCNGWLPPPTDTDDLVQAAKAIHDSIWKKTEAALKELTKSLGQKLDEAVGRVVTERVGKAAADALDRGFGDFLRNYEKSLPGLQGGDDADPAARLGAVERKYAAQLAAFARRAELLEERAALYESGCKELAAQLAHMVEALKGVQFAPPIVHLDQPAPQVTVHPEIRVEAPPHRAVVKHLVYDDYGRPVQITERPADEKE